MTTATLNHRSLAIDGMTGDACVQKVTGALLGASGVTVPAVTVGAATFDADQNGFNAARAAIGKAGYKTHDPAVAAPTTDAPGIAAAASAPTRVAGSTDAAPTVCPAAGRH